MQYLLLRCMGLQIQSEKNQNIIFVSGYSRYYYGTWDSKIINDSTLTEKINSHFWLQYYHKTGDFENIHRQTTPSDFTNSLFKFPPIFSWIKLYVITATAVFNFSATALQPKLQFSKIPQAKLQVNKPRRLGRDV